jgi:hypothetical protein
MKQTAVEQLGIAFREWQIEWDNYDGKKEPKPKSFDEFIKPFLEMESQQKDNFAIEFANWVLNQPFAIIIDKELLTVFKNK